MDLELERFVNLIADSDQDSSDQDAQDDEKINSKVLVGLPTIKNIDSSMRERRMILHHHLNALIQQVLHFVDLSQVFVLLVTH